jgi:hypothetical protein
MPDVGASQRGEEGGERNEHPEEDMRMRRVRQIAALGIVGLAMVATPVIANSSPVGADTAPPTCQQIRDDAWPRWIDGVPDGIDPHTTAATYMWHSSDGFHIRVTHRTDNRRTFSGQLTTAGVFVKTSPVQLERGDQFQVSPDRHSITFLFKNYGGIDGINFRTRCAPSMNISFQSDGKQTPPSHIVIGRNNNHPKNNPFTIRR